MLIKKLSAIIAVSGLTMLHTPIMADDNAEIKELLKKQQEQIEALQKKVEQQETVHNEALTHYIKNEVDKALEQKSKSLLTLGSHIENLTIKGDLRIRYEGQKNDIDDGDTKSSRDRFRQRYRLGFNWLTTEGWEIGAGIATGEDGVATSTNDSVSAGSPFEKGDIFLDYAYAKHKWDNFSLILGQDKNPFVSSDILWDSDVRFVGITGNYTDKDSGIFLTSGGYVVRTFQTAGGNNDDAEMLALQAGIKNSGFTGALSYYHFDSATTTNALALAGDDQLQLASAYLEYAGKTEAFSYKVWGEYTVNMGADNNTGSQVAGVTQEGGDQAWGLGAEIGVDKFKFKYGFYHFEANSAFGPLTDSDFGAAISSNSNSLNVEGHKFGIAYNITKNFEVNATYILVQEIDGAVEDSGSLFQLDFVYKF